jgi:methionyl-tRNA formyltransferase
VADGATVQIFYEARLPELEIMGPSRLEQLFDALFESQPDDVKSLIKRRFANKETLALADQRIQRIALDIAEHYKTHIRPNGFKAQVVAPSREAAVKYADHLQSFLVEAYPIITTTDDDTDLILRARAVPRDQIVNQFKDPDGLPEVLVVVAYGEILPRAVLDLPAVMPVNLHFSLLPELRGAAPVQRALLEGLTATGVTTIRMDEGMDTGPILLQATETIDPADDAGSLGDRLAVIGGRLLVDTLDRLEGGNLEERPQDGALATFAPKLKPEDEVIDWSEPAEAIVRRVRALSPEPGARTTFRARRLKVHRASGVNDGFEPCHSRPAGTVVAASRDALVVATGRGSLALEEVQLEGKRRLSGPEFARGHRVEAGERLG